MIDLIAMKLLIKECIKEVISEANVANVHSSTALAMDGPPVEMRNRPALVKATGWATGIAHWTRKAMLSLQQGALDMPLRNQQLAVEVNRLRVVAGLAPYAHINVYLCATLAKGNGRLWNKVDHGSWLPCKIDE